MSRYAHVTISTRELKVLGELSDTDRLRQIREWRGRLERAHHGGYRLADASVETVIDNVSFLLRKLEERNRA